MLRLPGPSHHLSVSSSTLQRAFGGERGAKHGVLSSTNQVGNVSRSTFEILPELIEELTSDPGVVNPSVNFGGGATLDPETCPWTSRSETKAAKRKRNLEEWTTVEDGAEADLRAGQETGAGCRRRSDEGTQETRWQACSISLQVLPWEKRQRIAAAQTVEVGG